MSALRLKDLRLGRDVIFLGGDGKDYTANTTSRPIRRHRLINIRYCVPGIGTINTCVEIDRLRFA